MRPLEDIAYELSIELGRPFSEPQALAELKHFKQSADNLTASLGRMSRELATKKQVRRDLKHLRELKDRYTRHKIRGMAYWYAQAADALEPALKLSGWGRFNQTENLAMSGAAAAIRKTRNNRRGKRLRKIAALYFEAATGERNRPLKGAYRRFTAAYPAPGSRPKKQP